MDVRGSYLGKRSFTELEVCQQRLEEDDIIPVKKKLRTKLVDLFNRASISMAAPEDYIKVYLRIKPFTKDENASQRCFMVAEEENAVVATAPEASHAHRNMKRGLGNSSHTFTFSRIFNENTSQGDFFNATMLGMTKDFISGQNSLVFSYGVTSSGKTYTIQGQPQNAGILPRCLDVIFNSINGKQISSTTTLKPRMFTDVVRLSPAEVALEKRIKERTLRMSIDDDTTVMTLLGDEMESALSDTATSSSSGCGDELLPDVENRDREKLKVDVEDQGKIRFGVWVSFAEIYNEQIFDLLEPFPRKKNSKRPILKISDDRNGNPYIKGLKEIHVESADEAYRLLTIGQRNLRTACTRLNHCSSRSHCMFNIKIVRVVDKDDPHIARVSMLSLCDLAGSERYSKTQATGDRLKEAGNINASLMTLGRCIETLKHNQLHRDQNRLVPFRDSKLTRLLQNYFNGSGRAVMIVNVSQCASMFDDTLHVFKFSAIAKQVKYIDKPPEPPRKLKEKKIIPAAQRPSIEWEVQAPSDNTILKDAQNKPLPDDDLDDDDQPEDVEDGPDENMSDTCKDMKEMRSYIKTLELRNERLVEMLQEEITEASSIESRVRQEVIQAMMKQVVNIEETYSSLLKETSEEAQELADERVRGIMAVYEQRLERIQRKVDEDDEWVSSLLYHREQVKVEEKDAEIADLNKQIKELKAEIADTKKKCADNSLDLGNSIFIETLTQKLQEANDLCKTKDGKIEELESLIYEAGEVYSKHMEEISQLTEQKEKIENQLSSIPELERQLKEITCTCDSLRQSLKNKEADWKATEEKLNKKIENKDATLTSLQDECKELHDEIERLQDQMSQMDENSKYRNELESSTCSEHKQNTPHDKDGSKDAGKTSESVPKTFDEAMKSTEEDSLTRNNSHDELSGGLLAELTHLKEEAAKKDKLAETLKLANEELEEQIKCLQSKIDDLVTETTRVKEKHENSVADTAILQKTLEQLKKDVDSAKQCKMTAEEDLVSAHTVNHQISDEFECLKTVNLELTKKVQVLETQLADLSEKQSGDHPSSEDADTTDTVKQSRQITAKFPMKDEPTDFNQEVMNQNNDSETVFSTKMADTAAHESLKEECDKFREDNLDLQKANDALTEKVQALEAQLKDKVMKDNIIESDSKDMNIAEMVRQIEQKTTPFPESSMSGNLDSNDVEESDDTEIVFNQKVVSAVTPKAESSAEMLKTPCVGMSQSSGNLGLAMKLKDAELANAALRSKLKRQEEDYFKREQALIHGYTAETENLKYELAKLKSKVDAPGRTLPQRGKRKAVAMDTSMSSSINENSIIADSKLINLTAEDGVMEKQSVEIVSSELLSVQQELLSLAAAYRKLQTGGKRTRTNSFIQHVVLGTPSSCPSAQGIFRSEENVGDSILQFELDEYAVKMDEMRTKISQQDDEIKTSKTVIEKVNAEKSEIENKLKEMSEKEELRQKEKISKLEEMLEKELALKVKLADAITERTMLEESVKSKCDELDLYKEKMSILEEKYNDIKETLEKTMSIKDDVENKLKCVSEKLAATEETMNNQKQEYDSRVNALKQQFSGEGEAKLDTIAKLEKCVDELKTHLQIKTSELEKVECQRQEAEAEVSQKLLMLEREKKLAERKAADAKDRELEWQLKCQGLDHMKQLEQQLHQRLRTAAETVRKHTTKTSELKDELASKNKELNQLREEFTNVKSSVVVLNKQIKETQDLEMKIKELQQALTSDKEQLLRVQKNIQEYHDNVDILKSSLTDAEETMEQQEKIINKQDDELDSLKAKLDTLIAEKDKLDRLVIQKELESANLNKQVSKLEAEIRVFQQTERKALDVEHICHDQLQKSQSNKRELEERLQKVERENQNLEDKLSSSEKQIKKEKKDLEDLEERLDKTEKQKRDLGREIERMTEKQKMLEEQMEKVNQQRVGELEQSRLLEAELKHLRKETQEGCIDNKHNDDLKRQNQNLKEELSKLKEELCKLKDDIQGKQCEMDKLHETLKEKTENLKSQEKELRKQDRINKRNREEMENWKLERDSCVSKLEQHINKRLQENKQLVQELEQLKKDNADLAKNVGNITNMKDSVIADLRKINNTLSIQLARVQGMSPPPKIATPDNTVLSRIDFIDDLDTTGHLEIDATPPVAAKKCRKQQSRRTHSSPSTTSSVDSEILIPPVCKSLKPIEEQSESSPDVKARTTSPTKSSFHGRVAELANEVIASISPLTRSAKRQESKKKKKSSVPAPFDLASYNAADEAENINPFSTRKSSRLRTRTKHTVL